MGCSVIILADNYNRATTPTTKALRRKGRSKGFVTDLLLSHCCGPSGAEPGQPYERDRGRWAGLRARAGVPGVGDDGARAGWVACELSCAGAAGRSGRGPGETAPGNGSLPGGRVSGNAGCSAIILTDNYS